MNHHMNNSTSLPSLTNQSSLSMNHHHIDVVGNNNNDHIIMMTMMSPNNPNHNNHHMNQLPSTQFVNNNNNIYKGQLQQLTGQQQNVIPINERTNNYVMNYTTMTTNSTSITPPETKTIATADINSRTTTKEEGSIQTSLLKEAIQLTTTMMMMLPSNHIHHQDTRSILPDMSHSSPSLQTSLLRLDSSTNNTNRLTSAKHEKSDKDDDVCGDGNNDDNSSSKDGEDNDDDESSSCNTNETIDETTRHHSNRMLLGYQWLHIVK